MSATVSGVGLGVGIISAGFSKGHGTVTLPIPEEAQVRWLDSESKEHLLTVELRKWIRKPKKFSGEIDLIINPDGTVSVFPARRGQRVLKEIMAAENGKYLEPTEPIRMSLYACRWR